MCSLNSTYIIICNNYKAFTKETRNEQIYHSIHLNIQKVNTLKKKLQYAVQLRN